MKENSISWGFSIIFIVLSIVCIVNLLAPAATRSQLIFEIDFLLMPLSLIALIIVGKDIRYFLKGKNPLKAVATSFVFLQLMAITFFMYSVRMEDKAMDKSGMGDQVNFAYWDGWADRALQVLFCLWLTSLIYLVVHYFTIERKSFGDANIHSRSKRFLLITPLGLFWIGYFTIFFI